jgi:excisionase family DNA binding protein
VSDVSVQNGLALVVELGPEQFEALARRVAERIVEGRDDGFLDVDGACAFLGGCSRKRIYALVERRRIRSHKVGGRLLFDPAKLRADVERGE